MKLAVTYLAGQVFPHFGHSEFFKLYEIGDGKVLSGEVVPTQGAGHGALAVFLSERGVDALVCGGIGGGAIAALGAAGIRVFAGVEGDADSAAAAFAAGTLEYDANARCSHHEHHAEGDCGTHDCASHGCGTHGCGR